MIHSNETQILFHKHLNRKTGVFLFEDTNEIFNDTSDSLFFISNRLINPAMLLFSLRLYSNESIGITCSKIW
jgi:hypothetical protein